MLKRHFLFLCAVLLAGLLSSCATRPADDLGNLPSARYADAEKNLELAKKRKGEEAAGLYLAAVDQAWQNGDSVQARSLLEAAVLSQASQAQLMFASTLSAEMALARQQPELALEILNSDIFERITELPIEQQARTQLARASALEALDRPMAAARERIYTAPYLDGEEAEFNHEAIWSLISRLPSSHYQVQNEFDLDGWLELARITSNQSSLAEKQQQIRRWQAANPAHPATFNLPGQLRHLMQLTPLHIKRVAIALPSQDNNQNVVDAIRNGFLSAYYQANNNRHEVPQLFFYDSNQITSLGDLYTDLKRNHIDLLIGPWEKDLVNELSRQTALPVPTLALNYSDRQSAEVTKGLYQFGLAAEDEARMAARQAWQDGKRHAAILVQSGDWGQRIASAFAGYWQELGGTVAGSISLGQPIELTQQIGDLMQLRESEARSKRLQTLLNVKLHTQLSRRRDVDFIFLAAPAQQARQIQPTLRFQYAGDLPIYATSAVNPSLHSTQMQELEGIMLSETPWLLGFDNQLREQIIRRWPEASGVMGRFYALGADAYQLAQQLQQLQALPNNKTEGLTGTLQMNQRQQIERGLHWAIIADGQARPVIKDGAD